MYSRIVNGALAWIIGLSVILGGVAGLAVTWRWADPVGTIPLVLACVAVAAGVLGCVWLRARRNSPDRIALLIIGVSIVVHAVYVIAANEPLKGDFLILWGYAKSIAIQGYHPPTTNPVIELRAFPYLIPLALLFHGSDWAYQCGNVAVLAASAWLVYLYTSALSDRRAGLVALGVVLLCPEPLLAAEIPSHDIPGAFFALLALYGMLLLNQRITNPATKTNWLAIAGGGVAVGIAIFLADLQRGFGPFLLATAALGLCLPVARVGNSSLILRRCAWGLVVPLAVFSVFNIALKTSVGDETMRIVRRSSWSWMAAHANSESYGVQEDYNAVSAITHDLDDNALRAFSINRTVSDFADRPLRLPISYVRRLAKLYELGRQFWFYLDDSTFGSHWKQTALLPTLSAAGAIGQFFRAYTSAFRFVFLGFSSIALAWLLVYRPAEPGLYGPVLFASVLTFALALLGEAQPRYMFPLWFVLPIYIGLWATRTPSGEVIRYASRVGDLAAVALLAGIVVFVALMGARSWHAKGNGFVLADNYRGKLTPVHQSSYAIRMTGMNDSSSTVIRGVTSGAKILDLFVVGDSTGRCGQDVTVQTPGGVWRGRAEGPSPERHIEIAAGQPTNNSVPVVIRATKVSDATCGVSIEYMRLR